MPELSVDVPAVKFVLEFFTITETPGMGLPSLSVTTPFTRLGLPCAITSEVFRIKKRRIKA
jgi:hypothetical protein